jgi:hypothetical protein
MAISISTDHLLLDEQGPTITAFGYEISWLMCSARMNSVGSESSEGAQHQGYEFYRELMIERLDTGRTWHWRKGFGRWTTTMRGGDDVDGWV